MARAFFLFVFIAAMFVSVDLAWMVAFAALVSFFHGLYCRVVELEKQRDSLRDSMRALTIIKSKKMQDQLKLRRYNIDYLQTIIQRISTTNIVYLFMTIDQCLYVCNAPPNKEVGERVAKRIDYRMLLLAPPGAAHTYNYAPVGVRDLIEQLTELLNEYKTSLDDVFLPIASEISEVLGPKWQDYAPHL
jgi:hypothetical protein